MNSTLKLSYTTIATHSFTHSCCHRRQLFEAHKLNDFIDVYVSIRHKNKKLTTCVHESKLLSFYYTVCCTFNQKIKINGNINVENFKERKNNKLSATHKFVTIFLYIFQCSRPMNYFSTLLHKNQLE